MKQEPFMVSIGEEPPIDDGEIGATWFRRTWSYIGPDYVADDFAIID